MMRSFIAYNCSMGNSRWVLSSDFADSALHHLLAQSNSLEVDISGSASNSAYYALGLIMQDQEDKKPVTLVTKSDKKTLETLLPALCEAQLFAYPMIIVTIGELDKNDTILNEFAQTIYIETPAGITPGIFSTWDLLQPLHIHLPSSILDSITDSSKNNGDFAPEAFKRPAFPPPNLGDLARTLRFEAYGGLVIMVGNLEPVDVDGAIWLCEELNVPVVADATSGIRAELDRLNIRDSKTVLEIEPPNTILRLGNIPSSPFWQALENLPKVKVFSISRSRETGLKRESTMILGDMDTVMESLGDISPIGDPGYIMKTARKRSSKIGELIRRYTESAQALIKDISEYSCFADRIYVAPGLLDIWNDVSQTRMEQEHVFSLQKKEAKHGNIACFCGVAKEQKDAWAVLDQLTDCNELNSFIKLNGHEEHKRVLISINPHPDNYSPAVNLEEFAESNGIPYLRITSSFDMEKLENISDNKAALVEIIPDPEQTKAFEDLMAVI